MEIWKPVIEYEKFYSVSSSGRIRREIEGRGLCKLGKIIKPIRKSYFRGYSRITLCMNGIKKQYSVHGIVASAFIGKRPQYHVINHKDGNKSNNCFENLEYVTPSQNQFHSYQILNRFRCKGSEHGLSKLKEFQVIEIREKFNKGDTHKSLAIEYGMSIYTIGAITRRQLWKHI